MVEELERQLDALEQLLKDGEHRIEEAKLVGADVAAWEEFWIELLHTYDDVLAKLNDLSDIREGR